MGAEEGGKMRWSVLYLLVASVSSSQLQTYEVPLCCPEGQYLHIEEDTTKWSNFGDHFETSCVPIPDTAEVVVDYDGIVKVAVERPPEMITSHSQKSRRDRSVFYTNMRVEESEGARMPSCRQGIRTSIVDNAKINNSSSELKMYDWIIGPGKNVDGGVEFDQVHRELEDSDRIQVCGGGFLDKHANKLCQMIGFNSGVAKYHEIPEEDIGKLLLNIKSICYNTDFYNCKTFKSKKRLLGGKTECLRERKSRYP